jgi:TRAP-type C4-dicarboxylate transport system substrate-binding protein
MYEPILMSQSSWEKLDEAQQKALLAAGKKAEEYMTAEAKGLDSELVDIYKKAGVEVVQMSAEDAAAWREIAQQTSYKIFAEEVPGGKELIEKALAVE